MTALRAGEFHGASRGRGDGARRAAHVAQSSGGRALADVGPATFLARLHGAGAEIALPRDTPIGLAIGLGGLGISLTDLARLYAGLARGGEAPPLDPAARRRAAGHRSARVTDPVAAYYVAEPSCAARRRPPPR